MLHRLFRSVATWPDRRGWCEVAILSLVALGLIAVIAYASGLMVWAPHFDNALIRLGRVMVLPALSEELVFRGLLMPARQDDEPPDTVKILWIALSVAAFTGWHVLEALTFLPGAHLFLKPAFLACASVLGAACAIMRYRTGSLWPCVLLHGLLVWLWQTGFGGPDVTRLLSA